MANQLGNTASQQLNSKKILENFAESASLHGIRYAANSRSTFRRIIWTTLVLIFTGLFVNQIIGRYLKLKDNKHITSIEVFPSQHLKFPAVTICNINMMKKSKILGTEAQLYLDLQDPQKAFNPKYKLQTFSKSFDIRKAVLLYGHNAKDLIEFCIWRGKKCTPKNFTTRFSHLYGLCHTFNSGSQGHPLVYSTSTIKDDGLILGLNAHGKEYYGVSSYLAPGVKVAVHEQNEDPMIENYGLELMAGATAEITINRNELLSLKPPYKSACGTRRLETTNTYSRLKCKKECLSREMMKRCSCKLLGMPILPGQQNNTECKHVREFLSCDVLRHAVGLTGISWQLKPAKRCDCPKSCDQVSYTAHVYSQQKRFKISFKDLMSLNGIATNDSNIQDSDRLIVNAFYKTLNTMVTVESPIYDEGSFFSDIGGFAGLFLGCSFLSLFELVDLFFTLCIAKFKARRAVQSLSQPQQDG